MKHNKIKKRYNDKISMRITAYLFLLPVIILWAVWFVLPFVQSFGLSFYDFNYAKPANNHFVGLDNYKALFQDAYFYKALKNTLMLIVVVVPIQTIFSLGIALCLNMKFKGRGICRTIFYMPNVISSIAVATVFMYLFVQDELLPTLFSNILGMDNLTWFADTRYALPFIMIMYIWQSMGFYMLIYLSGLQGISGDIYEAASIDGANKIQTVVGITIPLLKPVTFLVITYGMINAFQVFDQIAAISKNSPIGSPAGSTSTLSTYFYQQSFTFGEVGYGSAAAVVLFVMIFSVTLIQKKLSNSNES